MEAWGYVTIAYGLAVFSMLSLGLITGRQYRQAKRALQVAESQDET